MAVHAHPDDESSKAAAALLYLKSLGFEVTVVTCTDGGQGDVLNPDLEYPYRPDPDNSSVAYASAQEVEANIAEVRRAEMKEAARHLKLDHHVWLGFKDSGFTVGNGKAAVEGSFSTKSVEEAAKPLVAAMREHKPHVVSTYAENGGYPHLDHIMSHKITEFAFRVAGDPGWCPELGEAWQPLKLYYSDSLSYSRRDALTAAMLQRGKKVEMHAEGTGRHPTTRVKCDEFFEQARRALKSHATQVPHDFWFSVPTGVECQVYPYNDFELIYSYVSTPKQEPTGKLTEEFTEGLTTAVDGTKLFGQAFTYVSQHAPTPDLRSVAQGLSMSQAATLSFGRGVASAEPSAQKAVRHASAYKAGQTSRQSALR
ncbi:PIG-L family deacetylase [Streptomyces sp. NPDC017943]|uniref:PIG-L family deacetylase n=1 Tax=Streptomyces sp. NPDC017943 TaxID=3365019 RepID=UPI0037BE19C6